jgi:poly-gamma-glutamate synthesis protein (capsule biosynthesis protein)
MRIHTHHCQGEGEHSLPGGAPRTLTFAYREDVDLLQQMINDLRQSADIVVVSFHWGEGIQPFVLLDYELDTARRAIDFGADAVICHHHHTLRGVDFYRGQPIFHGICHFVPDYPHIERVIPPDMMQWIAAGYGEYAIQIHDDYPLLPMHPNRRNTMIAAIRFADGKVAEAGALPCRINPKGQPHTVSMESPEGGVWLEFFREASEKGATRATIEAGKIAGHDALLFRPA